MKATRFLLACGLLVSGIFAEAQISGLVTVNSASPTGGSNYQSFSALATVLNSVGVNGALTVNVSGGPYFEQVTFGVIPGVSATHKIKIHGNNCMLTFSAAATPFSTLFFNGTCYVEVDHFNIQENSVNGNACLIAGNANHNAFSACTFSASTASSIGGCAVAIGYTGMTSGSYNAFTGCTMFGGNVGVLVTGPLAPPFNTGNSFTRCRFTDWAQYGMNAYYSSSLSVRQCTVDRPTRTNIGSACYGLYFSTNCGLKCNGNEVTNLFGGVPGSSVTACGIYGVYNPLPPGISPNRYLNNIVHCIPSNGIQYGIYLESVDGFVYHNTVSLNDQVASTNGTCYGFYLYPGTNDSIRLKNNISYIARSGSGQKFCVYAGQTVNILSNHNVLFNNSSGGQGFIAYYNAACTSLSQLQAQNSDLNSVSLNPSFSASCSAVPTETMLNNSAVPAGVEEDAYGQPRSNTNPDPGAIEINVPACTGSVAANAIAPLWVCAGEPFDVSVVAQTPQTGVSYAWEVSSSATGPFTLIPGNSNSLSISGLQSNAWYRATLSCTLAGGATATVVAPVTVSVAGVHGVPYTEGFENLPHPDALPDCGWTATSPGEANLSFPHPVMPARYPATGQGFLAFSNLFPGNSAFTSGEFTVKPGVTYSVAIWHAVANASTTNFSSLKIMAYDPLNPSSPVFIASVTPTQASYMPLSGTFTATSAVTRYISIAAASVYSDAAFLLLDDFAVTIPCSGAGSGNNGVPLNVVASSETVCTGQSVTLTASGASSYTWTSGATTPVTVITPTESVEFGVYGTNTLSGCSQVYSVSLVVNACTDVKGLDQPASAEVFPNPAHRALTVRANAPFVADVVDCTGRLVLSRSSRDRTAMIDVAELPAGIYSVRVTSAGTTINRKLVVE